MIDDCDSRLGAKRDYEIMLLLYSCTARSNQIKLFFNDAADHKLCTVLHGSYRPPLCSFRGVSTTAPVAIAIHRLYQGVQVYSAQLKSIRKEQKEKEEKR